MIADSKKKWFAYALLLLVALGFRFHQAAPPFAALPAFLRTYSFS